MKNIPLLDLKTQYLCLKNEIEECLLELLPEGKYILGNQVEYFENEIAEYLGCKYVISCANGTDALILALEALGISSGDEVITTPFTFFATAEAISRVGATPVFVDVLCDTFNIDPAKIEEKISEKTKAILPVHIFGQPAQMNEIIDIASRHGLYVVEDACQAMGAEYNGNKAGTIGDMGCFSFFPTKNLSCFGDGGLITTNSERNAKILRALRAHGGGKNGEDAFRLLNENSSEHVYNLPDSDMGKYYNYMIGYNSRLDEIQAAILRIKLKYLDQWNLRRRNLAERYDDLLKNTDLVTQKSIPSVKCIFHQYIVQSERKDELCQFLKTKGVSTGVYYPVPLHLQVAYKHLGYKVDELPVSEYLSKRTLALPVYPELSSEDQDYIADCIYKFEQI